MRHLIYSALAALLLATPALAQPASSTSGQSQDAAAPGKTAKPAKDSAAPAKKPGDQKIVDVPKVVDNPLPADDVTGNSASNAMGGGAM